MDHPTPLEILIFPEFAGVFLVVGLVEHLEVRSRVLRRQTAQDRVGQILRRDALTYFDHQPVRCERGLNDDALLHD